MKWRLNARKTSKTGTIVRVLAAMVRSRREGVAFTVVVTVLVALGALPMLLVYSLAFVYLMFYIGMGMQMTWRFFWGSLTAAIVAGLVGTHLLNRHEGSGRAVFILVGLLSFLTVCLGGYVREAARPRFVTPSGERVAGFNRIPDYSEVYHPNERPELMTIQMVRDRPAYAVELPGRLFRPDPDRWTGADLVSYRCVSCHTLERVNRYRGQDWERVVGRMRAYGLRMTLEEMRRVVDYLEGREEEDGGQRTDGREK